MPKIASGSCFSRIATATASAAISPARADAGAAETKSYNEADAHSDAYKPAMPTPAADRIASARHRRRSSSIETPSMTSETTTPSPTRIGAVTHPRLAAITNSSTTPSAVATPPAHASVRAANSCSITFAQSTGSRGGLDTAGCGRGAAWTAGAGTGGGACTGACGGCHAAAAGAVGAAGKGVRGGAAKGSSIGRPASFSTICSSA